MKRFYAILAVFLAWQGAAYAETLSGTITDVDASGRRVTLMRDGASSVTVQLNDAAQLSGGVSSLRDLRTGSRVTVDATETNGTWSAGSMQLAGNSALRAQNSVGSASQDSGQSSPSIRSSNSGSVPITGTAGSTNSINSSATSAGGMSNLTPASSFPATSSPNGSTGSTSNITAGTRSGSGVQPTADTAATSSASTPGSTAS